VSRWFELSQETPPVSSDLPHSLSSNHQNRIRNLSGPRDKILGAQVIPGRYCGALQVASKDGKGEQPKLMSELLGTEVGAFYERNSKSTAHCLKEANAKIGGGCVREVFSQYFDARTVTVGAYL